MVAHGGLHVLLFIVAQYFLIIFYQNNGLWYSDCSWCHWEGKTDSSCHFHFDSLMVLFTRVLVTILPCVFQLPRWWCLVSHIKYFVLGLIYCMKSTHTQTCTFALNILRTLRSLIYSYHPRCKGDYPSQWLNVESL